MHIVVEPPKHVLPTCEHVHALRAPPYLCVPASSHARAPHTHPVQGGAAALLTYLLTYFTYLLALLALLTLLTLLYLLTYLLYLLTYLPTYLLTAHPPGAGRGRNQQHSRVPVEETIDDDMIEEPRCGVAGALTQLAYEEEDGFDDEAHQSRRHMPKRQPRAKGPAKVTRARRQASASEMGASMERLPDSRPYGCCSALEPPPDHLAMLSSGSDPRGGARGDAEKEWDNQSCLGVWGGSVVGAAWAAAASEVSTKDACNHEAAAEAGGSDEPEGWTSILTVDASELQ